MMLKSICRQGHIWVPRVLNPKRCPKCSSKYIYPFVNRSYYSMDNLEIRVRDPKGSVICHAIYHAWELEKQLKKLKEKYPHAEISVGGPPLHGQFSKALCCSLGFSTNLDKTSKIDIFNQKQTLDGLIHHWKIPHNEIFPGSSTLEMNVTTKFKWISTNYFNDYTKTDNKFAPTTPTTWQLDYMTQYNPDSLELSKGEIKKFIENWLVTHIKDAEVIFHIESEAVSSALFDPANT